MRASGLRRMHDVRPRTVVLSVGAEGRGGLLHFDTDIAHRVDELGRGGEIGLVYRNHVRPRITTGRILEDRGVLRHRHAGSTCAKTTSVGRRRSRCASSSATTRSHRRCSAAHRRIRACHVLVRHGPVILAATFDLVRAHAVDVEQKLILVPRREIENRVIRRDGIVDRLTEVPFLRRDRRREITARQHLAQCHRNRRRRRAPDDFRENANDVLEVCGRPKATVPPGGVARPGAHGEAGLVLLQKTLVHRGANHVESHDDHGVEVVVERIAERRREDDRAFGAGLVVVVHDLRQPLPVHQLIQVLGFGQIGHIKVAVVIVPRILVVQARRARRAALCLNRILHVALGYHLHAVGIGMYHHDNDVLENARRFFVVAAHELIARLDQLVCPHDFSRVQPAIDPDDSLALLGQRACLFVGQSARGLQPLRDFLVARKLGEIFGSGDDRGEVRAPLGGPADLHHLHTIGLAVDLLPIRRELIVAGEEVVVADVVAEKRFRRGDALRVRGGSGQRSQHCGRNERAPGAESPR